LLVLAAVAAGFWVVVLRADDGLLQTIALAGAVTAGVLIGLAGAPRRAIVVAVLIAIAFLVFRPPAVQHNPGAAVTRSATPEGVC